MLVGVVPITRFTAVCLIFLFVLHLSFYGKSEQEGEEQQYLAQRPSDFSDIKRELEVNNDDLDPPNIEMSKVPDESIDDAKNAVKNSYDTSKYQV